MSSSTSVQEMVRPAECVDLYYYDGKTSVKQCFATTQNTKYTQGFNNLGQGSSTFTIPPQNGIQDVVLSFAVAVPAQANCNLIAGWGYGLINQVSFRYGGSAQYFLTGQQILQNALRAQPSRATADDIFNLGGSAYLGASGASTQYAHVVLTLPHNIPSGVGKAHPLPTDALTQQVQITVVLNNPATSVFWGASVASAPTTLTSAQFQVQQVMLNNQGDALARRVDMAENAYAFPCEFVQQMATIQLANSATPQPVTLTGFRSGEVKAIHIWLTKGSDTSTKTTSNDPFRWYLPNLVEMLYAGDKYAVFSNGGTDAPGLATLWNTINSNKIPAFDTVLSTSGAYLSYWTELPFAQTFVDEDAHHMLVHGKPITNGIVNLVIETPSAAADWTLNVSYIYNSTLLFSQGTCDYVF